MDFSIMATWDGITYFLILSLLEIVLGIDNIIFISIISDRLPADKQRKARNLGIGLALVARLGLLAGVSIIMQMKAVLFTAMGHGFTGQSLVLLLGGLFLIYKSTKEMYSSMKGHHEEEKTGTVTLSGVITQIVLVDLVFSFDSVISAIGMTNDLAKETGKDPMIIIYLAVIVSMIVMMIFARQISDFINARPTIKMIALSFLVAIGVVLIAEGCGEHFPKGYIYFALIYSLGVEFLNIRMRKNKTE